MNTLKKSNRLLEKLNEEGIIDLDKFYGVHFIHNKIQLQGYVSYSILAELKRRDVIIEFQSNNFWFECKETFEGVEIHYTLTIR